MKIAIVGYSGAGKSTLAQQLGQAYGCPVLHLDRVHFLPGWQERPDDEARALVAAFMDGHPGWVIDGNYRELLLQRRLQEADRILFLNFPRRICLPRVLGRYIQNRGKVRASSADGCPEKFDLEFLHWQLIGGRLKHRRDGYRRMMRQWPGKAVELKTPAQVRAFLLAAQQAGGTSTQK